MQKLTKFIYGFFVLIASWFFGYFLLIDGPQGSHGDVEIILAASLAGGAYLIGIYWLFNFLKKKFPNLGYISYFFISLLCSLITFPGVIGSGFLFSRALKPIYCSIGPSSPSPLFYERCTAP